VRVFLGSQPVDMRAGHDGLFAIVKGWGSTHSPVTFLLSWASEGTA
jgi:hypothetical protein